MVRLAAIVDALNVHKLPKPGSLGWLRQIVLQILRVLVAGVLGLSVGVLGQSEGVLGLSVGVLLYVGVLLSVVVLQSVVVLVAGVLVAAGLQVPPFEVVLASPNKNNTNLK